MTDTTTPTIGVTGTTGRLGGAVAGLLAHRGVPVRLLVRDPSRAPELPGAQVARAAFENSEATRAALEGLDVVLMVSAAESPDRVAQHAAFADAAVAAGVRHVVYTSFIGAGADAQFTLARDHGATEAHLDGLARTAGLTTTYLRDNFYLDVLPLFVGEDGALRGPAGDGKVAAVAIADVARVAAAVLADPGAHAGATYDLTGPEALTLTEVAETITRVTGRPVRYVDETMEEAYASRAHYGAPDWEVDAWVSTYTAIASGALAQVSGDVEKVSGRAPLSLAQLLSAWPARPASRPGRPARRARPPSRRAPRRARP